MSTVRIIHPASLPPETYRDPLRVALRGGRRSVRWIVPTATLARHLRNELAREGLLVRPSAISTLSALVDELTPQVRVAGAGELRLFIRATLRAWAPPRWSRILARPGLEESLATLVGEMDSAGYSPADLAATADLLRRTWTDAELFLDFYQRLEESLHTRGLVLRSARLAQATGRLFRHGLPGVTHVFLEGFFRFTEPEIALLDALRRHAAVEIVLPDWPGAAPTRAKLTQRGFTEQATDWPIPQPVRTIVAAGSFENEVHEIARRILHARQSGRAFRDLGIIVRRDHPYVPALRTALARFGIPARFFFVPRATASSVFRYAATLVRAASSGWNHEILLDLIRYPESGFAPGPDRDTLDHRLRQALPGAGWLDLLDPPPAAWIALDAVRDASLPPREWATALSAAIPDLAELLALVAEALEESPLPLPAFWEECHAVAAQTDLRDEAQSSDAVAVLDAYEARQWRLPVMFTAGLLEGEFPRHPVEEPLFPDSLRRSLRDFGLTLRTLDDQQLEEKFLFELAVSRATEHAVLTHPRFNRQGEPTLASFGLQDLSAPIEEAGRTILRPTPLEDPAPSPVPQLPPELVAARHATFSPTNIDSYLQCPFQFFGRRTLKLEAPPARVEHRLDALLEGRIVHEVLARWQQDPSLDLDHAFTPVFERLCREHRVEPGLRCELSRVNMRRHLRDFAEHFSPRPGGVPRFESPLEFELAPGVRIRARIDRLDCFPDGSTDVYDFKYSTASGVAQRLKSESPTVQGGLYALGVEHEPGRKVSSFHYVALREQSRTSGWTEPIAIDELKEKARFQTLEAVEGIRSGDIRVEPRNRTTCDYCELRDACRIRAVQSAEGVAAEA